MNYKDKDTKNTKHPQKLSRKHLSLIVIGFIITGFIILLTPTFALNPNLSGDANDDNVVNISDIATVLKYYGSTNATADINNDGVINISDIADILKQYGKTYTPPNTGACTAPQHTPGGPDGMSGCWPGPNNTGVPAGTQLTTYACPSPVYNNDTKLWEQPPVTIGTQNFTLDSKTVNCGIRITGSAKNVVIKNSVINGSIIQDNEGNDFVAEVDTARDPNDPYIPKYKPQFILQDSKVDNKVTPINGQVRPFNGYACGDPDNQTSECGVGYKYFSILRTEIINSNRAAYCMYSCLIQDSYFHGTNLWPDVSNLAHASSVRNEQYLTLRHTSLGCDFVAPGNKDPATINSEIGCSANMSGYPDFQPIRNASIIGNLFLANNIGEDYCAYGGASVKDTDAYRDPTNATYIVFKNNVFQRGSTTGKCGKNGPITDYILTRTGNEWTNNKYDNGAVVSPQ